jgi:hypothetical protein
MKYLCNSYLGMTMNQIELLKKMKTRWVTVFKTCPEILMTQESMVFTNDLGSDKTAATKDDNLDGGCADVEPTKKLKSNDEYICSYGATVLYGNKGRHESTAKHKKNA